MCKFPDSHEAGVCLSMPPAHFLVDAGSTGPFFRALNILRHRHKHSQKQGKNLPSVVCAHYFNGFPNILRRLKNRVLRLVISSTNKHGRSKTNLVNKE